MTPEHARNKLAELASMPPPPAGTTAASWFPRDTAAAILGLNADEFQSQIRPHINDAGIEMRGDEEHFFGRAILAAYIKSITTPAPPARPRVSLN